MPESSSTADFGRTATRYVALNCSLKPGGQPSSTDVLLGVISDLLEDEGCTGETIRVVDQDVRFGVTADEGDGDGWPAIRQKLLDAHLVVWGTPIWLGHPASVCQMALERLDAFLGDTDERNQMRTVDRVAVVGVVGNEDGAHHVGAEVFQGLNDCGFTLAPGAMTYWVGEAMQTTDLRDLPAVPEATRTTAETMVTNAMHLVHSLRATPFPSLR